MNRRALAVPFALAALALAACGGGGDPSPSTSAASSIDGVQSYTDLARDHTADDVSYPQSPPVGGAHDARWLTCMGTVYDQPVRDENAVHSMEHGAVWVAYQPDLPADQVQTLVDDVDGVPFTFLTPYEGLDHAVVLTAWGLQLRVDAVDDPRIAEFIAAYANGPQTPEPGAACEGGLETG